MEISLCLSAYDDMNPTAIDAARFWGDGRTPDAARPLRRTRPARSASPAPMLDAAHEQESNKPATHSSTQRNPCPAVYGAMRCD